MNIPKTFLFKNIFSQNRLSTCIPWNIGRYFTWHEVPYTCILIKPHLYFWNLCIFYFDGLTYIMFILHKHGPFWKIMWQDYSVRPLKSLFVKYIFYSPTKANNPNYMLMNGVPFLKKNSQEHFVLVIFNILMLHLQK